MANVSSNLQRRKIHKRVRFDVNPLFDNDNDSPDEEYLKNRYVHESEVLHEDPLDPSHELGDPLILTEKDFWEYLYSHVWNGRLRVREGNLQRSLIRIFDELVVNHKIGSTESIRYYQAIQLRGRNVNNAVFAGRTTPTNIIRRKKKCDIRMEDYLPKPDQGWSTWKRNIVRTILVILSFGLGYAGRNYYAYIYSLSGAIGSSVLGFVLPCSVHLIIKKDSLSGFVIAKDILLILFGIIAGLVGFVVILIKMIES